MMTYFFLCEQAYPFKEPINQDYNKTLVISRMYHCRTFHFQEWGNKTSFLAEMYLNYWRLFCLLNAAVVALLLLAKLLYCNYENRPSCYLFFLSVGSVRKTWFIQVTSIASGSFVDMSLCKVLSASKHHWKCLCSFSSINSDLKSSSNYLLPTIDFFLCVCIVF